MPYVPGQQFKQKNKNKKTLVWSRILSHKQHFGIIVAKIIFFMTLSNTYIHFMRQHFGYCVHRKMLRPVLLNLKSISTLGLVWRTSTAALRSYSLRGWVSLSLIKTNKKNPTNKHTHSGWKPDKSNAVSFSPADINYYIFYRFWSQESTTIYIQTQVYQRNQSNILLKHRWWFEQEQ